LVLGGCRVKRSRNETPRFTGSSTGTNGLPHRKPLINKRLIFDARVVSGLFLCPDAGF
jgi:hypothetical protein